MDSGAVLITGGDGYLARGIARRILAECDRAVILWTRSTDGPARRDPVLRDNPRVTFAQGDLTDDDPLEDVDRMGVAHLIHAAAVTRFNVEAELADRVNVEGTRRMVEWAKTCPGLESFTHLSTVYAVGLEQGVFSEEPRSRPIGFANHYERSKWESEEIVLNEGADLPWRILRVATVVAENEEGLVVQRNAFHNTLELLYHGLISVLPGDESTPLHFVTAEFVSGAVTTLFEGGPLREVMHVCHEAPAITLGELVELAFERFGEEREFRRRRIEVPLFCDQETFDLLAAGLASFSGEIVSQAVSSVAPFAPQLYSVKEFANDRLRAALPGYRAPDLYRLLSNTCTQLIHARWNRRPCSETAEVLP